jgi:O-methyltransferase
LFVGALSVADRLRLLKRFIATDWNVAHAHRPCEIVRVCEALAERPARQDEVMIEAGCWQGGSSVKFSIICKSLGYRLHIYDSFEGVEPVPRKDAKNGEHDFSGEYAAPEAMLQRNLARYGEGSVCAIHKGWFADTLAAQPVPFRVRVAYIDCDLAKGTLEALQGVVPRLVEDGWVFSQDFHLPAVETLLRDAATWRGLGRQSPTLATCCGNMASLRFWKSPEEAA